MGRFDSVSFCTSSSRGERTYYDKVDDLFVNGVPIRNYEKNIVHNDRVQFAEWLADKLGRKDVDTLLSEYEKARQNSMCVC